MHKDFSEALRKPITLTHLLQIHVRWALQHNSRCKRRVGAVLLRCDTAEEAERDVNADAVLQLALATPNDSGWSTRSTVGCKGDARNIVCVN